MRRRFAVSLGLGLMLLGSMGVGTAGDSGLPPKAAAPAVESYLPGLGDFMTAYVQPHHIKLWFAANARNWVLAAYEADELAETFEDISTYQVSWKSVPVAQLGKAMIEPALILNENVVRFPGRK